MLALICQEKQTKRESLFMNYSVFMQRSNFLRPLCRLNPSSHAHFVLAWRAFIHPLPKKGFRMSKFSHALLLPVLAIGLTACASATLTPEDRTVNFPFGKSDLTAEAKGKLDHVVSVIKDDSSVGAVNIVGYADRIGNAKANDHLSKRRANTVKRYMEKKGWNYSTIDNTRWVGESESNAACGDKATRATIDCLAPDRKVEVELMSKISDFCTNWTSRHCRQ